MAVCFSRLASRSNGKMSRASSSGDSTRGCAVVVAAAASREPAAASRIPLRRACLLPTLRDPTDPQAANARDFCLTTEALAKACVEEKACVERIMLHAVCNSGNRSALSTHFLGSNPLRAVRRSDDRARRRDKSKNRRGQELVSGLPKRTHFQTGRSEEGDAPDRVNSYNPTFCLRIILVSGGREIASISIESWQKPLKRHTQLAQPGMRQVMKSATPA